MLASLHLAIVWFVGAKARSCCYARTGALVELLLLLLLLSMRSCSCSLHTSMMIPALTRRTRYRDGATVTVTVILLHLLRRDGPKGLGGGEVVGVFYVVKERVHGLLIAVAVRCKLGSEAGRRRAKEAKRCNGDSEPRR